jgi:hypothetical protein
MNFETFNDAVLVWAASKNITNPETQLLKFFEEKGEFARALLDKDEKAIQDELGDLFVVGCVYFWQRKVEPVFNPYLTITIKREMVGQRLVTLDKYFLEVYGFYFDTLLEFNHAFNFDLSETLGRVLTKISVREGQTIDGCFFKK